MALLKVPVSAKDHIQGNPDAKITLVEYGDYECPGCSEAYPMTKLIQKRFGDKLRFVFRHFPLNEIHPVAEAAAETTEFASVHHRFWEIHDLIYVNQNQIGMPLLIELTKALELSVPALEAALKAGTYRSIIQADIKGGESSGVDGTPTFYINGQLYEGAFELDEMIRAIEQHL